MTTSSAEFIAATPSQWKLRLEELPIRKGDDRVIPAFFFAHGHPGIVFSNGMGSLQGIGGPLHNFLKDFGSTLLEKYDPKGIVIFSAHWENFPEIMVTDYGNDQPLLYDYYGFPTPCYQVQWHSNGSTELSNQVITHLTEAGLNARKTNKKEVRGEDGVIGESSGLDHGVFIPFMLMFPEGKDKPFRIPVVQVSIDGSLDPARNIKLGQAISALRRKGILILSGGLTIHNVRDMSLFDSNSTPSQVKEFEHQIIEASLEKDTEKTFERLINLTKLKGFRKAHPREEHFLPIYIAAGAGSDEGETKLLCDLHGCKTFAFGVA